MERRHTPGMRGATLLNKFAEREVAEEDAGLRHSKILAVPRRAASPDGGEQPASRAPVIA